MITTAIYWIINLGIGALFGVLFLYKFTHKEEDMRDVYVALVAAKARTCDPANKAVPLVPVRWREAVIEDLKAIGLDANGDIL